MNNLEKEFVPYEIALDMKELGFDEPCFGLYAPPSKTIFLHHYGLLTAKEQVLAPLYQQTFRWFREKYNASPLITCYSELGNAWKYHIPNEGGEQGFNTYEEAELACLVKLIEIVKNGK